MSPACPRLLDVLIFSATGNVTRHDVTDFLYPRIMPLGHGAHHNIAVRDHAHQPIILAYRKRADVERFHAARSFLQSAVRFDALHVTRHNFLHSHDELLYVRCAFLPRSGLRNFGQKHTFNNSKLIFLFGRSRWYRIPLTDRIIIVLTL